MMPEDLKELLRAFNDHGVKYLVAGGYAFDILDTKKLRALRQERGS